MNSLRLKFLFHLLLISFNGIQSQDIKKTNTEIADSLDIIGEYKKSLSFRTLALQESDHTNNYKMYIKAKWHYTNSCIYEIIGGQNNHKKALEHSLKAREITEGITDRIQLFRLHVANRIYHQYGYLQDWKNAHYEALKALKITSDTLPENDYKVLLILDDLGFINTKIKDYQNSIVYYQKSNSLYLKYYKENKKDLAMNFEIMANNYRALGMRKKELEILQESEKIWRNLNEDTYGFAFKNYNKQASWYTYYGNYNLAESFLNYQLKIIDSLEHKKEEFTVFRRHEYLSLFNSYIDLNLKKKDYKTAQKYIELSENELKTASRDYIKDIEHEAQLYYYKSLLPNLSSVESVNLIEKAIDLTQHYKEQFFLDPVPYQIALFEKHKELGNYEWARSILINLIENYNKDNGHELFYLLTNYGFAISKIDSDIKAEKEFIKAFKGIHKEKLKTIQLKTISIENLKPIYSFETIEGILLTAEFYFNRFKKSNNIEHLETSFNLSLLASNVFNNLYLGDRYNETLYNTYKSIDGWLMQTSIENPTEEKTTKTIEAIENNSSKLTWSKFMYSNNKHHINVPDSIIDRENEIKTLLVHYQKLIYSKDETSFIDSDTLNNRITNLNFDLKNLQKEIKENYSNYFTRNNFTFDLNKFRKSIKKGQLIVKYVLTNNNLYCFKISKSNLEVEKIEINSTFNTDIKRYVENISTFNSNPNDGLDKIKHIIKPLIDNNQLKNVTIIPYGILNYLPFETLIPDYGDANYNISYGTSLTLLNEQNLSITNPNMKLGVFASSNNSNSELPSVKDETNTILGYFEGELFNNATKETFLAKANHFEILHLAMHSKIDNINPEFSSLDFSENQLLISELYNESINADLVVLSACESGSGNFEEGEGVQSISRAFTYTGIPSTVMSLWKVDDHATAKIMIAFYKHLKAGEPKDIALKNAKIDYLNSTAEPALRHPYYWAGFVVSGNTSPIIEDKKLYRYLSIAGIGFLFLLLIYRLKFSK
ncbi:CHAT domain-containing protein [Geojedonia litorea]|uniref:CHAT domain-containing protein n=1 Tax=Geojedonia litorea TaxID=1268269 RepID=A0ABV9N3L5_9FLAO